MSAPSTLVTDRAPRAAALAFSGVVAAAAVLFSWLGREQWFFQDEWRFLAERAGGDVRDLLTPHSNHWSTLPILAYRGLWNVVGLQSYVPYQALSIGAHLIVAILLWHVMRRSGVGPWIRFAAASTFALLGSGSSHIVWGFGVTFTASVAFGLAHLLLADHDGPVVRRDLLGVVAGLGALACSGVGVTMVVAVAVSVLARRGWRAAAFHAAPLAALYLWWVRSFGSPRTASPPSASAFADFVVTGITNALVQLGRSWVVAAGLLTVLVAGWLLIARSPDRPVLRHRAAPLGLLAAMPVFFAIAAYGRAESHGVEFARAGRYVHVAVALMLPGLAVAADAVARWRPPSSVPAAILLVLGVPANVGAIEVREHPWATREVILTMANLPGIESLPDDDRPLDPREAIFDDRASARGLRVVSVAWLRDSVAAGRIPSEIHAPAVPIAVTRLVFDANWSPGLGRCRPLDAPVSRHLAAGDGVGFRGGIRVGAREPGGPPGWRTFPVRRDDIHWLEARFGPIVVTLVPDDDHEGEVCG